MSSLVGPFFEIPVHTCTLIGCFGRPFQLRLLPFAMETYLGMIFKQNGALISEDDIVKLFSVLQAFLCEF